MYTGPFLILEAAKPGIWGAYEEYFRVNVTGTVHVIDACIKNKVRQLIYTSSPSVVFDDKDMHGANESVPYPDKYLAPYPETKALAEKEVIKAAGQGLCVIILRPHLIWGVITSYSIHYTKLYDQNSA